jgi:hypothetical protein
MKNGERVLWPTAEFKALETRVSMPMAHKTPNLGLLHEAPEYIRIV